MSERKLEPKDVPGTFLNLVSDTCIYSSTFFYSLSTLLMDAYNPVCMAWI